MLATDDLLPTLDAVGGLRRHLHMAAGANFVFEGNDRRVPFARKKALKPRERLFLDLAGELCSFCG